MFKFLKLTFLFQQLLVVLITLTLGHQNKFIRYQQSNGQIAEPLIEYVRTGSNSILLLPEPSSQIQNSSATCSISKTGRTTSQCSQYELKGPSSTVSRNEITRLRTVDVNTV